MKRLVGLAVFACAILMSPVSEAASSVARAKPVISKGPKREIGEGTVYAWVERGADKKPRAIGVTLSAGALRSLPALSPVYEYDLKLPRGLNTPFDHITLDWNPGGHEPAGVYDLPHFDVHFYMISRGERAKITCTEGDLARCEKKPADKYVPQDYIATPGGVFQMGAHWIDPTSDEFNGKPFYKTFLFGFYNGKMNFFEPMLTLDYLQAKLDFEAPIKQPQAYQKAGYYPQRYRIYHDAKKDTYTVSLEDLRFRPAN